MKELFIKRIEELDLNDSEKEFIFENISIFTKIYLRGIRDAALSLEEIILLQFLMNYKSIYNVFYLSFFFFSSSITKFI